MHTHIHIRLYYVIIHALFLSSQVYMIAVDTLLERKAYRMRGGTRMRARRRARLVGESISPPDWSPLHDTR